jgi:hypothetical protein
LPRYQSRTIPSGVSCLLRLSSLGIRHKPLPALANVHTPVLITSPIAGIHYKPTYRAPLKMDCRLAIALFRAAPILRRLGVSTLYFSNTYRPHPRRARRMSRHAMGLAIDVHRVALVRSNTPRPRTAPMSTPALLRVKRDFQRDMENPCDDEGAPVLNRVACLLKRQGVFDRVLTPDTDAAHYNHFHLALISFERRRYRRRRRHHPVVHE